MRPVVADGVAWSVGLSVTIVSPVKTAEPIEMSSEMWTRGGSNEAFIGPTQDGMGTLAQPGEYD